MGITNGQPVNETYTNPAFLDRRQDDTAIGKYTLNNTDTVSGSSVTNVQREHNSVASFVGKSLNSAKDDLPAWLNTQVGASNDTLKTRTDLLTGLFDGSTGHIHDGTNGQGPKISAPLLSNVPLRGYEKQATALTGITGSSTNVSSLFTGATPNGGPSSVGVVTTGTYNKVLLRQASGANTGDVFKDSLGNTVYGRLTQAAGVWTLSFYVLISSTETAYSFATPVDVDWYYQEIFNPMVSVPTYSQFFVTPSDNATADVITATQAAQGKVLLSSAAVPAIGTTSTIGTPNATVANADHTHEGLHSICKQGSPQLKGDVELIATGALTLSQSGQQITLDSAGAIGYQEVPFGVVNGVNNTFGPLTYYPSTTKSVVVFVDSIVVPQSEYSLTSNYIVFNTNIPKLGQQIYVFYLYSGLPSPPPVPIGAFNLEYHTLTSGEIAAKQFNLNYAPAVGNLTVVDLIGAGPQIYNVDFTTAGAVLYWTGFGLDGLLSAGDILRIQYFT